MTRRWSAGESVAAGLRRSAVSPIRSPIDWASRTIARQRTRPSRAG